MSRKRRKYGEEKLKGKLLPIVLIESNTEMSILLHAIEMIVILCKLKW